MEAALERANREVEMMTVDDLKNFVFDRLVDQYLLTEIRFNELAEATARAGVEL